MRWLVLFCLIGAVQALCMAGFIAPGTLPAPSAMFVDMIRVLSTAAYWPAIVLTLRDIVLAAGLAIIGGFVCGLVLHGARFLRRGLEPLLASYYAVPTFIFYPVLVAVLGAGRAPIIAIAVALAIVAMISATLTGLDHVPPVLSKSARVLRLSPLQIAFFLQLPAALPYLFTGMKLAVAYAFIGVIASEFILSGDGIGYQVAYAYNNFDNPTMYGLILLVMIAATGLNAALDAVDRRLQSRKLFNP